MLLNNMTSNQEISNEQGNLADYIQLLKPRVMSLVVFTGLIGILLAPVQVHPLTVIISVICIAFGSGAAGAFNMWHERKTDALMTRTQKRPLPQGRLLSENAFEFALVVAFSSVFAMALLVNYMAATLLLAAILFYVFIYTIWLKPRTPQNIVIGGAAGAFPPMIGWASATGEISIESILLFLIIFFWTPPHFWALSLYKNEDYTKAGIPMLPVVAGVDATKKQMLIYTILLSALTMLPQIIGMSGIIYSISAITLNAIFMFHAIRVFRSPTDKNARAMFGFSILYLFLIFLSLMVDNLAMNY